MNAPFIYAKLGEISNATLRTVDLLESFSSELEGLVSLNGAFLSLPENAKTRERFALILGECSDIYDEDGTDIAEEKQELADELVNETLPNALNEFAPPYSFFSSHEGDGACFGFWPNIDDAKESADFVSSVDQEFPEDDFTGEWLHINERGNCTLYVRELTGKTHLRDGAEVPETRDSEIWSIV